MKDHIKVKGCGCRYRQEECDHLCDKHQNEFILKLYNHDKKEEQRIERSCKYCYDNHKLGLKICYCGCHIENRWFIPIQDR